MSAELKRNGTQEKVPAVNAVAVSFDITRKAASSVTTVSGVNGRGPAGAGLARQQVQGTTLQQVSRAALEQILAAGQKRGSNPVVQPAANISPRIAIARAFGPSSILQFLGRKGVRLHEQCKRRHPV